MKSLSDLSVEQCQVIDQLADKFEDALRAGQRPSIENVLAANSALRPHLLRELLAIEIEMRRSAGERFTMDEYNQRFLGDQSLIEAVFRAAPELASTEGPSRDNKVEEDEPQPERLGRYVIQRKLGRGGFGVVYLAHDEQLNRPVAIKVPHAKLIAAPEDAEAYLAEARTVASLDHPGIVPVHDVGSTINCRCYIVTKYVPGTDLATKLKQERLAYRKAAELVATVADALHYAHKQGLVHRDVKPGNILIGNDGKPYVVDFGLALREEDIGKGPKYAGTPAYMSPEQVHGEGHRVDGRSDIFSLGVVFYELLAGRRPFRGDTRAELFEQVTSYEAKPLRQYDEKLPKELERICQKAMAKRASDRYSSAHDMAEDLRLFLVEQAIIQSGVSPGGMTSVTEKTHLSKGTFTPISSNTGSSGAANLGSSGSQSIKIVPKGLRSFDANDADFFLELLPGPRDRDGLPDSLRFWKTRIEETDPDNTFSVGVIYGPSGCGKSSLVKAGLLPRLSEDVIPVYIEATPGETEARLLHGLRKGCPALEDNMSLKATLMALRRGQGIPVGKKVLIVLDQFEQWLHAPKEEENSDLVQALRQCDGGRVQCIVMVRDDFWMAATRFMRDLEIRLVEAQNSAAVDLFPIRHAEKVLAAFGRAFGTLPEKVGELNKEQKSFITKSVAGLAEEGKVNCVRLALFAEMMKGKAWTPATLKEVGGTKGVGVTFLEETFSASTSPPEHRYHQHAARAVLKDLLPDGGTDIKGTMRSYVELLEASGYGNRPKDFDDLVRILDREIRLITPTDPEGNTGSNFFSDSHLGTRFYQLTHDYMVHSLREWLTRKQKETRRGRAELRLFDTSVTWNSKPENRFLPSLPEWLSIRTLTDSKRWTDPQRAMMRSAGKLHGLKWGGGLVALLLIGLGIQSWASAERWKNQKEQTRVAVASLQNNLGPSIPFNIKELRKLPQKLVLGELTKRFELEENPRHKLALALALADFGRVKAEYFKTEYLVSQIDDIAETDTGNFVEALKFDRDKATVALKTEATKCLDTTLWRRKAKLAIASLGLSSTAIANDMCTYENRPDPEQRTLFIDEFPRWELALGELARTVRGTDSSALRSGICLGVGSVSSDRVSEENQRLWKNLASEWFVEKGDTSTHSAASWLLRQWKLPMPEIPKQNEIRPQRDWFVNSVGSTMLRIRPVPPDFHDPIEGYRQQLEGLENVAVSEMEIPEARAIAYFHTGKTEEALKDFDRLLTDADIELQPTILQYRTLALAKLGRADEARESLVTYQGAKLPAYRKAYVEIQVSAWLGETETALRQLGTVSKDFSNDVDGMYDLACAAALCAQATTDRAKVASTQFVEKAFDLLARSQKLGFSDLDYLITDPDFAILHRDPRFYEFFSEWNTPEWKFDDYEEYWVADCEVTRGQFEQFMSDEKFPAMEKPNEWNSVAGYRGQTAAHPADTVSWYDAAMYCNWLSLKEGLSPCFRRTGTKELEKKWDGSDGEEYDVWEEIPNATGYRLLRSTEWAYVCRAGTETEYSSGNDETLLIKYCQSVPARITSIVGSKLPNALGLHDMHGNVREWCIDRVSGWKSEISGGSWSEAAANSRSFRRSSAASSSRSSSVGFRLALSPSIESKIMGAEATGGGTEKAPVEHRP